MQSRLRLYEAVTQLSDPADGPGARVSPPPAAAAGPRGYFLETTAPLNVEDPAPELSPEQQAGASVALRSVADIDEAIDQIADHLNRHPDPVVVISVHGFNVSVDEALDQAASQYRHAIADDAIHRNPGLVCISYRWPAEKLLQPLASSLTAMPGVLWGVLLAAVVLALLVGSFLALLYHSAARPYATPALGALGVLVCAFLLSCVSRAVRLVIPVLAVLCAGVWLAWHEVGSLWLTVGAVGLLAVTLVTIPLVLLLLRVLVYYRDSYRALNYGIADLVEFFRVLDRAVYERGDRRPDGTRAAGNNVRLSFIGHSMGGFVVTNLVRTLSDVFDPRSIEPLSGEGGQALPGPEIGNVFRLSRLILASPDIPAEALMMRRANFLRASLRRFDEAYLFTNEGDEVLRMIATIANFFAFPTRHQQFGFRLGNVHVADAGRSCASPLPLGGGYGIVNLHAAMQQPGEAAFLEQLQVGRLTLRDLSGKLLGGQVAGSPPGLPLLFTYFDCTDYRDRTDGSGGKKIPVLTRAKGKPRLSTLDHWGLLLAYLLRFCGWVDVHAGYFSGKFSQQLIYRLACLGFDGLLQATYGHGSVAAPDAWSEAVQALSEECKRSGIRILLSPVRVPQRRELENRYKMGV